MKNLITSTIEKIKNKHIRPEPKWKYLVRVYGIWFLFSVVIIFGAISFSVAYYLLTSLDWDLYRFIHTTMLGYSLSIFPYFWAVLIGIFIMVAFFDVRRTETGYKFSWLLISAVVIGGIIMLGVLMSYFDLGSNINNMMASNVPYYGQHMTVTKESQWSNSRNGFLSGTINSISKNELKINDLQGKSWIIKLNEETLVRPRANISTGQMIKIIGNELSGNIFQANEIRPWVGMGMGMNVGGQGNEMMNESGYGETNFSNSSGGRGGMMRGN